MKTWKRLFSCLLAGSILLSLAACGSDNSAANDQPTATQPQQETAPPADTGGDTAAPETNSGGENMAGGSRVLVVYFSASGHTESVANYIAQATGGDLFAITPAEPYTCLLYTSPSPRD